MEIDQDASMIPECDRTLLSAEKVLVTVGNPAQAEYLILRKHLTRVSHSFASAIFQGKGMREVVPLKLEFCSKAVFNIFCRWLRQRTEELPNRSSKEWFATVQVIASDPCGDDEVLARLSLLIDLAQFADRYMVQKFKGDIVPVFLASISAASRRTALYIDLTNKVFEQPELRQEYRSAVARLVVDQLHSTRGESAPRLDLSRVVMAGEFLQIFASEVQVKFLSMQKPKEANE